MIRLVRSLTAMSVQSYLKAKHKLTRMMTLFHLLSRSLLLIEISEWRRNIRYPNPKKLSKLKLWKHLSCQISTIIRRRPKTRKGPIIGEFWAHLIQQLPKTWLFLRPARNRNSRTSEAQARDSSISRDVTTLNQCLLRRYLRQRLLQNSALQQAQTCVQNLRLQMQIAHLGGD